VSADDITRILLTEDSRSYALALRRFIEHDPDLKVVGTCGTIKETAAAMRTLDPDLLILDLELPDGNGIEAIPQLLAKQPVPILVLSDHADHGSEAAAAALAAGALDAHPKRALKLRDPGHARGIMFRRYLKRLSRARVGATRVRRRAAAPVPSADGRRIAAIGICASTGGPAALRSVLSALPARFPIPVLVVQHITKGFVGGLVDWLAQDLSVPVRLAVAGAPMEPGVTFADDGAHLTLDGERRLRFDRMAVGGYHCPAADVLFASMATTLRDTAAAVVLTGMGSDGAEGMAAVGAAGGFTIAQDEASSAIYGMPRAASERGADLVLPVDRIGPALAALKPVRGRARD